MVEEADRGVGLVADVEVGDRRFEADHSQQRERAVEDAAFVRRGDDEMVLAVDRERFEPEAVGRQLGQFAERRGVGRSTAS